MSRVIASALLVSFAAFAQTPKFEIADVHVTDKTTNQNFRVLPVRAGRYEIRAASMVGLIRTAYGVNANKIVGGPSWIEMDRFDVIAKVPAGSTPETQKLMLQALLEDRFNLVVHKDTKPVPTYVLTAGKSPRLKNAVGSEEPGCRPEMTNGVVNPGPGMTIQYLCRNTTMQSFTRVLTGMVSTQGLNEVVDQTDIGGSWNFDVKWSAISSPGAMMNYPGERISVFDAVDKQLGLKLERKPVPTPVIVVDSVNRNPTDNPSGEEAALPPVSLPTEFEVADVRPSDPESKMSRYQAQPGGKLIVRGQRMRFLLSRAFNTYNFDEVAGLPKWADTDRFDITAKAPASEASAGMMDLESVAPLLRALLVDRFKMTWHTEERSVSAYSLVSVKPKMKKADPASRSTCKLDNAPDNWALGSLMITCQNVTMAQLADQLRNHGPGLAWPVLDATGIEGGWDFTLTFSQNVPMMNRPVDQASDPTGAITIFEAVQKQLGLKLETRKRQMPIIVIDHIEQKPTDN